MNKLKYILIVMAVLLGLFMLTGMFYGAMLFLFVIRMIFYAAILGIGIYFLYKYKSK